MPSSTFLSEPDTSALTLQRCADCHYTRFPPRSVCPRCLSGSFTTQAASGRGTVFVALTVFVPLGGQDRQPPFNISIIELEEGVRVWSNVVDTPPADVNIGDPVTLVFRYSQDVGIIPQFVKRLADE